MPTELEGEEPLTDRYQTTATETRCRSPTPLCLPEPAVA